MWIVLQREPRRDATVWSGRRLLAAVDAVAWPIAWIALFRHAPQPGGIVVPFVTAVATLCAVLRLHRAVWLNHRYWFTTWRWGKVVAAMLLMVEVMKLSMLG